MSRHTIYVALLDEAVDVWRPVDAEKLRDGNFRIVSANPCPEDERGEFEPGSLVRCELKQLADGPVLAAVARVTPHRTCGS